MIAKALVFIPVPAHIAVKGMMKTGHPMLRVMIVGE